MLYRSHPVILLFPLLGACMVVLISLVFLIQSAQIIIIPSDITRLGAIMGMILGVFVGGMVIGSYLGTTLSVGDSEILYTRIRLPFTQSESHMGYNNIAHMVTKKDSPLDHIFDIGDLIIRSKGGDEITLSYLASVDDIATKIQLNRH